MRAKREKKGFYYSIDAIVALLMILTLIIVISYTPEQNNNIRHLPTMSEDILSSLSSIKVSDSKNEMIMQKIAAQEISNREQDLSVLGYIAELWAKGDIDEARDVFYNITAGLPVRGLELSIEDDIIYRGSYKDKGTIGSSSRIMTGVSENNTQKGISAKSYLTGIGNKITSDFVFFGGFVGQGEISKRGMELPADADIISLDMEADVKGQGELYINNQFCRELDKNTIELKSKFYDLSNCTALLHKGTHNMFTIKFTSPIEEAYIGGGIISAKFKTAELNENSYNESIYYFPGIKGIINIYSSINPNEDIQELEAFLHMNVNHSQINNATLFFSIGNTTIYSSQNLEGEHSVHLDNEIISNMIDYDFASTIPIRIGFSNLSYTKEEVFGNADVILITDLSGSMNRCVDSNNDCSSGCPGSVCRIDLAKDLIKEFTENLLSIQGNRVSLVTYSYNANTAHVLSNDTESITSIVDSFSPNGATCVGCSLREARKILQDHSDDSRDKYIIMMTDGIGNMRTYQPNLDRTTCCTSGYCNYPRCGSSLYYSSTCNDYLDDTAKSQSIADACYAHEMTNATINSVGFGAGSIGCDYAIDFLEEIASCGNGTRYSSNNVTGLKDIYSQLASGIINSSKISQTISMDMSNVTTTLYNDSYIKFKTAFKEINPTGKISIKKISDQLGTCNPTIRLEDAEIIDAYITSFSSNHWTDRVDVNGIKEFDLSLYSENYHILGDPFIVTLRNLIPNHENSISISVGDSPTNSTGCSPDSRLAYNLLIDTSFSMDKIYQKAEGCVWEIEYYDSTTEQIPVPKDYSGARQCTLDSYDPENAIDNTAYQLFNKLDVDKDKKIDIKFDENNFEIETIQINEIPDLIGPSRLMVRVW